MLIAERQPEPSTVSAGVYPCEGSTDRSKVHEGPGSQPEDAEEPSQETFRRIQVVSLGTSDMKWDLSGTVCPK